MPPLPRLRVAALDDLASQLRYSPGPALRRQVERVESLAGELDADRLYPEDWIVQRLTGYRPEMDDPASIVGEALLADLSALAERLSDWSGLERADLPDGSLDAETLCARWGISRRTLDRYCRRGLIARRVKGERGRAKLYFAPGVVDRFERVRAASLGRAGGFSRIPDETAEAMIRRARRYHESMGCTLNQAAARLAARYGRSHEAVRQLLRRHERRSGAPIFGEPGPIDARQRAMLHRADRRGIETGELAERTGRSVDTVRRAIRRERCRLLAGLALDGPAASWFGDASAVDEALAAGPVASGLGGPVEQDLRAWIIAARTPATPNAEEERALAAAVHLLRWRAREGVASMAASNPEANALDRVETDLRWVSRLKVQLLRAQARPILRTLESRAGRPLDEMRARDARALVGIGLDAASAAVDAFDPFRGGRLAARVGMSVDRAAAAWLRGHKDAASPQAGRATPRIGEGVTLGDWSMRVDAWQGWLEPTPRIRGVLGAMDPPGRAFAAARYGLTDETGGTGPPGTLDEMCASLGLRRMEAPRVERAWIRRVGCLAREAGV